MFKQHRHKIFSVLTVACLSLSSPFFVTRNSWAGEFSPPETTSLIKQLKSQNVEQRLLALQDFNSSTKYERVKPESVIPFMIDALKDPDARVRQQSALSLRRYLGGSDPNIVQSAQAAIPPLITALKDPNKNVRVEAAIALGKSGVPAKLSVPVLITALKDPKKDVRLQAANSLGLIGAPAESAVPALIASLKHSNRDMRQEAANALGRILGHVGLSTPSTFIMRSDFDRDMWESATNALIKASDKDPDKLVQMEADSSLQNMGASPQGLWLGTNSIGCGGASSTK